MLVDIELLTNKSALLFVWEGDYLHISFPVRVEGKKDLGVLVFEVVPVNEPPVTVYVDSIGGYLEGLKDSWVAEKLSREDIEKLRETVEHYWGEKYRGLLDELKKQVEEK